MAGIEWIAALNDSPLQQSLRKIEGSVKNTSRVIEQQGGSIERVFENIRSKAVALAAGFSAQQFVSQMVNVRGEFQQLEVAFKTMLGNAEKADALMQQLTKTAAITPFDLKGVTQGAKQLLAYGIEAEKVNDTLIHLGDIAAGLSIPLNDLVYLYGTTMTQGRMFTQDLRQFQNRGIPIAEELAKVMGVAKDKVGELVTAGKVGAEEFNKAIMSMSSEGGKFGGLMEAQSKTISGQISNIEDAIDTMFNEIGKKSEGVINSSLSGISFLVENYETIGKIILTVATAYGTYKAALLAVIAAHKMAAVWGEVQAFLSLAKSVTSAKDAMLLFTMVCKASPIGLLLGAITATAVAFGLFSSSSDKATSAVEKYGKSAANTIDRVRTLSNELKGLSQNSSLHRQVMDELNQILDQYGITQIKESDNIDTINQKRERAIELIQQEGAERQRLNALEAGNNTYEQRMKDARDELVADLKEAQETTDLFLFYWLSSADEVQKNADAIAVITADVVEQNLDLIAGKTGEAYEQGLNEIYQKLRDAMAKAGLPVNIDEVADNDTFGHDWILEEFIESVKDAKENLTSYTTAVEAYAASIRAAASDTDAARDVIHGMYQDEDGSLQRVREAADFTKTSTTDLVKKIFELQKACDGIEREIDIKINLGANITFDNEDVIDFTDLANAKAEIQKRIDAATNDAAVDALLKDLREGQASAEYGSQERAAYTRYINQLQARRDANSGNNKGNKGKSDAERERQEMERNQKDYERMMHNFATERENLARELAQSYIDIERDASTREIMQLQHDHKQEMAELQREKEEYVQKKIELEQAKAKADGKTYTAPANKEDVLDDQERQRFAQLETNTLRKQQREMEEYYRKQSESLVEYMKEYGSIQQQKLAITKEYEQKIADETDAIQKAALQKQRDRLINELNMKALRKSIDWDVVFNDIDRVSTDYLLQLRVKLREALNVGDLELDDAKILSEKILEIENRISERTDIWSSLIPALKERVRLTNEVAEAEVRIRLANQKADKLRESAISQVGSITGSGEGGIMQVWDTLGDSPEDILSYFGIDGTTDAGKQLTATLIDLTAATEEATEAEKHKSNVNEMLKGGSISDIFNNAIEAGGGGAAGYLALINQNAQSMSEFVDKIGLENTDFGQAVHGFSDGVGGFNGAIQSLASGDVFGAINGIVDGFQGFGHMLGIGGGNAEKVNAAIERLNDRNEILTQSIDRLNDTMSKQGGSQAIESYAKLAEMQKELEDNLKEQMELQMSYHSAHGSFNHYWNGFSQEQLDQFNRLNGTDWSGDFEDLTADLAAMLMADADMWQKINDTGKGGYGERVAEKIAALAEQAGVATAQIDALNASLTAGTTKESVFDDFLGSLYDLADGSEDVMDDIAKNWQQMVNRMVVNNLVGENFREQLEGWYKDLADLNKARQGYDENGKAITPISDAEYKRRLDELREQYSSFIGQAQEDIGQLTEMGIIQSIEDVAEKTLMTIDDIKSGWMNMLMDMTADTEDWAQDIAKAMTEALIEDNIFNDEWEKVQEEWLSRYNQYLKDQSLTDVQRKALLKGLQDEQEAWVEDNRRRAREIMEMTGYDTSRTQEQSASVQAMGRITVDQADELIGRMNAGQMIWEQGNELSRQIANSVSSIGGLLSGSLTRDLGDLVSLAADRNQHLGRILGECTRFHDEMLLIMGDLRREIRVL